MKRTIIAFLSALFFAPASFAVNITVDTSKGKNPISPYIYGVNQDISSEVKVTCRRLGGNRTTGYNWENNASNAGNDWQHYSDNWLIEQYGGGGEETGRLLTNFHDKSLSMNAYSMITLPMAGYVAKDKKGPVTEQEKAPSERWAEVVFKKPGELSLEPDKGDGKVYLDEEVNFIINRYGKASSKTGVKGYCLDNEADLWSGTHPRIHPEKCGAEEYINKSIEVAKVVKGLDPDADIFGPCSYGFHGYRTWQDAPDFLEARWKYDWYLAYYLARMKEASDKEGKRLLDVLDIHWYPEAKGNNMRVVFVQGKAEETAAARVQAPRSLWDPSYTEDSWLCGSGNCPLELLPKIKRMIDKHYPGTKLAVTEYDYGGGYHPSGGVATADALGIFGKYGVYTANLWMTEFGAYTLAAFRLYRNYDGKGGVYGDTNVKAATSDVEKMTVYASLDSADKNALHLILINKELGNTETARISLLSKQQYKKAEVWGFDSGSGGKVTEREPVKAVKGNKFSLQMPPLSAYHVVLRK
jgi:mannan endo-1,4-beta-mannosidase